MTHLALMVLLAFDGGAPPTPPRHIRISAARFRYSPETVPLKMGETVVLELVTEDRKHGFNAPDFGVRADVEPGKVATVTLTPQRKGQFPFHCDIFCGSGHEEMTGAFVVTD